MLNEEFLSTLIDVKEINLKISKVSFIVHFVLVNTASVLIVLQYHVNTESGHQDIRTFS